MKWRVSCVTYEPKLRPTMQCHVGLYFLSNSFFIKAAISFSILYFSRACVAQSTASCCISSLISAFLITALRSDIFLRFGDGEDLQI
uniref:Putative conserved plasma membrane protein n=1 Tax=Lutzomyia longipalpis TaxID=7200 RepID=A0A7G3AE33_LUTLO